MACLVPLHKSSVMRLLCLGPFARFIDKSRGKRRRSARSRRKSAIFVEVFEKFRHLTCTPAPTPPQVQARGSHLTPPRPRPRPSSSCVGLDLYAHVGLAPTSRFALPRSGCRSRSTPLYDTVPELPVSFTLALASVTLEVWFVKSTVRGVVLHLQLGLDLGVGM